MSDKTFPSGWLAKPDYYKRLQQFPTCFRELIDFYEDDSGQYILLEKRSPEDIFYAGKYATMGSTILMRETFAEFEKRHAGRETGIQIDINNIPDWVFCGLLSTPNTRRHHGTIEIFARKWTHRPATKNGQWYEVSTLATVPVVPSCRAVITLAIAACLNGAQAEFVEFLGTDD